MLIKTVRYQDFNDEPVEEELHFHLSKVELVRLDAAYPGGLEAHLNTILEKKDHASLLNMFEDVVSKAYGIKSADGKTFVKNEELLAEFKQSGAYDELIMDLLTSEGSAEQFFTAILPKGVTVPNNNGAPKNKVRRK